MFTKTVLSAWAVLLIVILFLAYCATPLNTIRPSYKESKTDYRFTIKLNLTLDTIKTIKMEFNATVVFTKEVQIRENIYHILTLKEIAISPEQSPANDWLEALSGKTISYITDEYGNNLQLSQASQIDPALIEPLLFMIFPSFHPQEIPLHHKNTQNMHLNFQLQDYHYSTNLQIEKQLENAFMESQQEIGKWAGKFEAMVYKTYSNERVGEISGSQEFKFNATQGILLYNEIDLDLSMEHTIIWNYFPVKFSVSATIEMELARLTE